MDSPPESRPEQLVMKFSLYVSLVPTWRGWAMMSCEGSSPKMSAIHSFASFTLADLGSKNWRYSTLSKSFTSTGFSTCNIMGGSSPGSTRRSSGPGTPKPGPSTSSQPAFSVMGSNSTHSPPFLPLQVRPVVKTVEPTCRVSFTAASVAPGSFPSRFTRVRCITRYSTTCAGVASASLSDSFLAASSAAATAAASSSALTGPFVPSATASLRSSPASMCSSSLSSLPFRWKASLP
mmetsp:Transcript_57186/g.167379  ORF Transcript_57186/g.167379 Transcript_57186/m.167379 type:complete len:235 (-) Transcript_57186:134-838(-)